ncbi:MAG: hypothetical protein CVT77_09980 [Alphaproteobacteria bacterium HGW-Alphaproteobacteria-16]|nr:MAG: hypothetical protein CVT77_09980 [Alphaproteobacteria bacterium HGW-Alphaproteobacteria-16]
MVSEGQGVEPVAAERPAATTAEEHPPRRVHLATVAIWFLKNAPQNLVLLPAFAGWSSGRGFGWALLIAGAVGAVSLFFAWLSWWRFTYEIGPEELTVSRGILNRTRRSIPLERIQDVSIERKPLARLFGLAEVRVETGGGDKDEAVLDSVTLAEAERVRAALRGHRVRRAQVVVDADGDVAAMPEDDGDIDALPVIFVMPLGRILLLGLFSFSLVWIAALFGLLQFFDQFLDFGWDEVRDLADVAQDEVRARFSIAVALTVALIAVVLGFVSGVVRTALREWGFTLRAGTGRFRRTRGLLTRSEVVVAIRRIQLALIQRGPLRGALGWQSLSVQTLGGSNDPSGRQVLAPLARDQEVADIVNRAALPPFERPHLRPVSSGHVVRAVIQSGPLPLLAFGIAGFLVSPLLWWGMALTVPMVVTALLQRRYHRYALRHTSLQVMRGVIGQRAWILPYDNVQVVTLRSGLLQRWLGIATVLVDTAGAGMANTPDIVDVALDDAREVATGLVNRVE